MWLMLLQGWLCAVSASCGGGGGSSDGASVLLDPPLSAATAVPAAASVGLAATSPGVNSVPLSLQANDATAAAAVAAAAAVTATAKLGIRFNFTLAQSRTTSAGVYGANGALVRTLWRGERMPAGTVSRSWDQRDDQGNVIASGDYTIKVVHHDVKYVWDGVVGNSSSLAETAEPHKSFLGIHSLAATAGRMHYVAGYNEGQNAFHGFDLANPQVNRAQIALTNPFIAATAVAADGERLYWVNAGGLANKSFVAMFDLASGTQRAFAQGTPVCLTYFPNSRQCYDNSNFSGVLELRDNLDSPPTGLAVQKSGRLLAVAYGADNQVRIFDKGTGRLERSLSVILRAGALNQIAFAPGGDLWVLTADGALRYTALSTAPVIAANITGLARPLAITVDATNEDGVWVADGASSQQVKRFDRFGNAGQTIGLRGGAAGHATVSADRLCFQASPDSERTALAVDDMQSVWVVDTCNNRLLQFSGGGRLTQQIAYLPSSYVATVDSGAPTRVFANFLEFAVDYTKPLGTPGAWTLVRNWLQALPAEMRDSQSANLQWGGFRTVTTLANGRTYAHLVRDGKGMLVELKADGSVVAVRSMPAAASNGTPAVFYENGDIGWATLGGARQTVLRLALQRFDAQGNPVWAAEAMTLASVPISESFPYYRNGTFSGLLGPRFPLTETGLVVFFDPSIEAGTGYHLGAAVRDDNTWAWQASPSGALDDLGSFQTRKVDPGINYGGNAVMAVGRHVVYGYHGEFYTDLSNGRVGQANQFMHFRDDGMFIGQFGVASTRATSPTQPGLSGNAFSPTLVRYGGQVYLYHNDESTHGGVHRWRLQGADDIREMVGRGGVRSAIELR